MTDLDKQARELLAAQYAHPRRLRTAINVRRGLHDDTPAFRAVRAALTATPEGFKLVPVDHPDVFDVRANGEWGTFGLRKGQLQHAHGTAYWCELIAATSFGTVSHYWGSMGEPAEAFLPSLDRGYALGKLWGMAADETDVDATLAAVRHDLIEARRRGDIDKENAREAWDSLPDGIYSEDDLRDAARDSDYLMSALVDGDCLRKRTNPQADGFWRMLWPEFIKQLTAAQEVGNG